MNQIILFSQRVILSILSLFFCLQIVIAEEPAEKPSFYDESGNGQQLIDQAYARAQRDGKRVLLQYGGNWCIWCVYLHNLYESDPEINKVLHSEYEIVYVDVRSNRGIEKQFGGEIQGVPFLTVLEPDGSVVTHQSTEPLEKGKGHDPAKVLAFLNQWKPAIRHAVNEYEAAQKQANETEKTLWVYFDGKFSPELKAFDDFVVDKNASLILNKYFVFLKINESRMIGVDALKEKMNIKTEQRPWNQIQNNETILTFQLFPKSKYEDAIQRDWKSINSALRKFAPQINQEEIEILQKALFSNSSN